MDTATNQPQADEAAKPENNAAKDQVKKWLGRVKVPDWLDPHLRRARLDRKYLHTDIIDPDNPDRVTSPDLLRSIWAKLAQMWPDNPEPVVRPPDEVEPSEEDMQGVMDAGGLGAALNLTATGAPLYSISSPADVGMQPGSAFLRWKEERKKKERLARTASIILRKIAKDARLGETLEDALQEAFTTGICWLKIGWEEDYTRDMLGRRQWRRDGQDQALRLKQLTRQFMRKEWDKDDGRYKDMMDLTARVKRDAEARLAEMMSAQVSGDDPRVRRLQDMARLPPGTPLPPHLLPEVERWQSGTVDLVQVEDIRLDWGRVTSLRSIDRGRFICERVWLDPEYAERRFKLTEDEKKALGKRSPSETKKDIPVAGSGQGEGTATTDPEDADLEANERNGDVAIWEAHDTENGYVYWFADGIDRMLDEQIPEVTTPWGHPYLAIGFNRVSGRFYCLSDVYLGKKSQEVLNQSLTDDWEAAVASYPFYITKEKYLEPEDIQAIEQRQRHKVVQLSRSAKEVKDAIEKMPGETYEPEKHQVVQQGARQNIERAIGVSSEQLQGKSAYKFATQSAIAQDASAAQASRMGKMVVSVMGRAFDAWLWYSIATVPEKQAKAWAGQFAYWPAANRDQLANGLLVEVITAGNRGTRRQDIEDTTSSVQAITALFQAVAAAAAAGRDFDPNPYLDRINAGLDVRMPAARILRKLPPPVPALPAPGAPGATPAAGGGGLANLPPAALEQVLSEAQAAG